MTPIELLLLVVLAVALLDKLFDLDHECWRHDCSECRATRSARGGQAQR